EPTEVHLTIEPKPIQTRSLDGYLNSIELSVSGATPQLSVEITMAWSDIDGVERYRLGIHRASDRKLTGRASIRFVQKNAESLEWLLGHFEMESETSNTTLSGTTNMPDLI